MSFYDDLPLLQAMAPSIDWKTIRSITDIVDVRDRLAYRLALGQPW